MVSCSDFSFLASNNMSHTKTSLMRMKASDLASLEAKLVGTKHGAKLPLKEKMAESILSYMKKHPEASKGEKKTTKSKVSGEKKTAKSKISGEKKATKSKVSGEKKSKTSPPGKKAAKSTASSKKTKTPTPPKHPSHKQRKPVEPGPLIVFYSEKPSKTTPSPVKPSPFKNYPHKASFEEVEMLFDGLSETDKKKLCLRVKTPPKPVTPKTSFDPKHVPIGTFVKTSCGGGMVVDKALKKVVIWIGTPINNCEAMPYRYSLPQKIETDPFERMEIREGIRKSAENPANAPKARQYINALNENIPALNIVNGKDWKVGDIGRFKGKGGESLIGLVYKKNPKKVNVITTKGTLWNVSPANLETISKLPKCEFVPTVQVNEKIKDRIAVAVARCNMISKGYELEPFRFEDYQ